MIQKMGDTVINTNRLKEARDEVIQCTRTLNMRPMILLMALSGCYTIQSRGKRWISAILLLYKGFLTVIILLYVIRNVILLSEPNMLLTFVAMFILSSQSFGNIFISGKIFSKKYGNYGKAMKRFHGVLYKMKELNISINTKFFNRRLAAFSISALLIALTGIIIQGVIAFVMFPSPDEYKILDPNQTLTYTQPLPDTTGTRLLLFFALCLHMFPFCIPGFFLMTISVMLLTVFKALDKRFDQVVNGTSDNLFDLFERLRKFHVELCSVVSHLDKDLGFMYGNIFFWTVGEALIIAYMIVKYPMPAIAIVTIIFYLGFTVMILASVSVCAALVHEAVSFPSILQWGLVLSIFCCISID